MGLNKKDLIDALTANLKELQQSMDMHCRLVALILGEKMDESNHRSLAELSLPHSREIHLKEAIKEAIDVLEESKKTFKSKRLELLRKRLTQVLIDTQ